MPKSKTIIDQRDRNQILYQSTSDVRQPVKHRVVKTTCLKMKLKNYPSKVSGTARIPLFIWVCNWLFQINHYYHTHWEENVENLYLKKQNSCSRPLNRILFFLIIQEQIRKNVFFFRFSHVEYIIDLVEQNCMDVIEWISCNTYKSNAYKLRQTLLYIK